MKSVREAVRDARDFMSSATFDPWVGISSWEHFAFVIYYCCLIDAYSEDKKKSSIKT